MEQSSKTLKARRLDEYPYHLEYRTRWSDNDMYDHMNNSIYYFLFDSIINSYLINHCGQSPSSSDQIGIVVRSDCHYFGAVGFPALLDLGLKVNQIGKSSVTYEVGVFERGREDVKAVGGYTHVFVDRTTMRPSVGGIHAEAREGLSKLQIERHSKI